MTIRAENFESILSGLDYIVYESKYLEGQHDVTVKLAFTSIHDAKSFMLDLAESGLLNTERRCPTCGTFIQRAKE